MPFVNGKTSLLFCRVPAMKAILLASSRDPLAGKKSLRGNGNNRLKTSPLVFTHTSYLPLPPRFGGNAPQNGGGPACSRREKWFDGGGGNWLPLKYGPALAQQQRSDDDLRKLRMESVAA